MTDPSLKRPASPGGEVDAAAAARAAGAPPAGGSNPPPPPPSAPEEDISHGQRLAADAGRADRGVPRVDGGGGGAAAAAAAPPPQSATLLVPASAAWFSYASVHALEKEALPEWFDGRAGGGDGAAYRATRNALVDAGRAAVAAGGEGRRLSFTGARAALAGTDGAPATDGPSLLRLHTFLDYWGIINFAGVGGQAMATAAAALPAGASVEAGARLPGPGALFAFPRPSVGAGVAAATGAAAAPPAAAPPAGTALVPFLGRRDRHGRPPPSEPPLPPGAAPRFFCSAMPWVDCTPLRYHCTRVPDVDLCPEAYADGRFPPGCSGRDFVRLEGGAGPPLPPGATAAAAQLPPGVPPTPAGAADWADQETLLLLEGVEVYGDDWAEVAEHVGTKSAAACLRRFLQLPLADSVASALEAPGGAPGNGSRPVGEPVADGPGADRGAARPPLPFADAGNPVLAQVACLAAMVGPRVAAAAAARAMEVIAEEEGGMGGGADAPVPDATARAAAAAGLAAAAVKARALAAGEEREVLRMAASAAAALATRIAAKVKALDDLGVALDKERAALDRARDAAYVERRALESRRVGG
jgi:SWI/SNF related-matrix-associated actin-dependent regulator of chromatin subfamily C